MRSERLCPECGKRSCCDAAHLTLVQQIAQEHERDNRPTVRVDVHRGRLLKEEPALRVQAGGRVSFAREVRWRGGRVVQIGSTAHVELQEECVLSDRPGETPD